MDPVPTNADDNPEGNRPDDASPLAKPGDAAAESPELPRPVPPPAEPDLPQGVEIAPEGGAMAPLLPEPLADLPSADQDDPVLAAPAESAAEEPAAPDLRPFLAVERGLASDGRFHELDSRVQRYWSLVALLQAVFLSGVAALIDFEWLERRDFWPLPEGVFTGICATGLFLSAFLLPGMSWRRWRWAIREKDILLHFGVLTHTRRSVPRSRIQHVNISSGPLARAFGLVQVTLFTAGSDQADATIPGLEMADAEALRELLLAEDFPRG